MTRVTFSKENLRTKLCCISKSKFVLVLSKKEKQGINVRRKAKRDKAKTEAVNRIKKQTQGKTISIDEKAWLM